MLGPNVDLGPGPDPGVAAVSDANRLRGGGSGSPGSSLRMFMIFDRLAGTWRGGSGDTTAGVDDTRGSRCCFSLTVEASGERWPLPRDSPVPDPEGPGAGESVGSGVRRREESASGAPSNGIRGGICKCIGTVDGG